LTTIWRRWPLSCGPQVRFVVQVADAAEQRDALRLLVDRDVGVLDVAHRRGTLPLAQ
jgi:hypothetical protein